MSEKEQKKKLAIALEYTPDKEAPVVIATGKGALAEKILTTAGEEEIPIYKDDKLANTLSKLELGDMIPEELYGAIAEILVFVDRMDRIKAKIMEHKA
ncbi:MAG: EscU/YscU/HrcU family type III secretion system export apparatus switch protein [Lachnospiraceae bacterium]|nr:EscU/YscU/HrcU family type III secretion system export apparatus switch protein [Lachnospiraceae bacterium]